MNDKPAFATRPSLSPTQIAACLAWAVVVAVGGGLLIGWLLAWRVYGNIGFMLLGFVAGWVARRINGRGVPWVGLLLAAAMFVAFFLAEATWLHVDEFQGAETWSGAAKLALKLPQAGPSAFVIGLVCTVLGAYSAWWWGGSRWKLLMVEE